MIRFGQSETPLTGTFKDNFSLMKQADFHEAVAAAQGLKNVILVAHDMGQTVGLELMTRQEEGKLPFHIKHAVLRNGSTLVDMVELTPGQQKSLKMPDSANWRIAEVRWKWSVSSPRNAGMEIETVVWLPMVAHLFVCMRHALLTRHFQQ